MWLSRPGRCQPSKPTRQVRQHHLIPSQGRFDREQNVVHGVHASHSDLLCVAWTLPNGRRKPKQHRRLPLLTGLLAATHGSGTNANTARRPCRRVKLSRASGYRPQVDTRFGTRGCACRCFCVLSSVSRGLEPNKAKSAITHHPRLRPPANKVSFSFFPHQQTINPPPTRGCLHSAAV